MNQLKDKTISVGELFNQLEHRSFGGIIVLLSLLGLIPGVSVVAGFCILILSVQIIAGRQTPKLPNFFSKREINVVQLKRMLEKPLHYITQLEKLIKPRYQFMLMPLCTSLTGVIILCLAFVMISPLPLSNILPALALFQISLGLLENDGLAMLSGWISSVIAIAVGVFMILTAIEFTTWALAN